MSRHGDRAKRLKVLRRRAEHQGWAVAPTGGGHVRFVAPDGTVVILATSPSDWRAEKNDTARLRRAGLDI